MKALDNHYPEELESLSTPGPQSNVGEVVLHAIARFPMTIGFCVLLGTVGALAFALEQGAAVSAALLGDRHRLGAPGAGLEAGRGLVRGLDRTFVHSLSRLQSVVEGLCPCRLASILGPGWPLFKPHDSFEPRTERLAGRLTPIRS